MIDQCFRRCLTDRRERGKRKLGLPLFCAFMLLAAAAPVSAQLTVSQLEVTVTPSTSGRVIASFVVHNTGKNPAQAIVTREDWDRAENGENRFVPSGSTQNTCGVQMSAFPTAFRIEPGADQTIRIAVEKSENLSKECWDILFVQQVAQKRTLTRSGLEYIFRTGVKVYVAPAALKRDASITGMTAGKGDTRIAIQFRNDGQVHLTAKGRIEFRRLDNSIAGQLTIAEFPTLPGAVRQLDLKVPSTIPPGTYIALALIDFGGAEIAAGQLELNLR